MREPFNISREIDGIRIYTKNEMKLLRRIPEAFNNIFKEFSSKPVNIYKYTIIKNKLYL